MYGFETSLTLKEGISVIVFENQIPNLLFGHKMDENGEGKKTSKTRNFIVCSVHGV